MFFGERFENACFLGSKHFPVSFFGVQELKAYRDKVSTQVSSQKAVATALSQQTPDKVLKRLRVGTAGEEADLPNQSVPVPPPNLPDKSLPAGSVASPPKTSVANDSVQPRQLMFDPPDRLSTEASLLFLWDVGRSKLIFKSTDIMTIFINFLFGCKISLATGLGILPFSSLQDSGTGAHPEINIEQLTQELEALKLEKDSLLDENNKLKTQLAAFQDVDATQPAAAEDSEISEDAIRKRLARIFKPRADGIHGYC